MARKYFPLITLILFCAGCGIKESGAVTPTAPIVASTLPPSLTHPPSETPLPPPPTPTPAPVEGISSTPINVRAEPSTASETLGILPANTKVQIIGKDAGENWWQIIYPEGKDGKGWVAAQYVRTVDRPEVPIIGGVGSNPNANVAVVQQQLNVRSGPGTSFNSVGVLNPQDVVALIGKDSNGAWLQIEFSAGPDGKGWINAAFVQTKDLENLPIVTDVGIVIGTGTPAATPATPFDETQGRIVPAPMDNDSAQAPAIDIAFSANGTRSIQYTSDVSSPSGDADDWIQFTPYTQSVFLEVSCSGGGLLIIGLLQNNQPVPNWENLTCGESRLVPTHAGEKYLLHLRQANASDDLKYAQYVIKIASMP